MSSGTLEWTPFTCLPVATLTHSGLLELDRQDQEVELLRRSRDPLELRWEGGDGIEPMAPRPKEAHGSWKPRQTDLHLILTTHRCVFFHQTSKQARFVHLSNVHQVTMAGGPTVWHPKASYKVILSTFTYGDLVVACRQSSKDEAMQIEERLQKALTRKAWEAATRWQASQQQTHTMVRRRVGVDAILTKHKLQQQQYQQWTSQALSGDAELLLEQASALLQVITKYTTLLNKQQTQNEEGEEENEEAMKLSNMLQDMGMTSALTKDHFQSSSKSKRNKKDAHRDYYEWLARQVVDFFWPKIDAMGGTISLTDVYCLLNRARGTNLVSPEDLRKACDVLNELQLGLRTRTFDSGIVVLEKVGTNMDQNDASPLDWQALCPLTALQASHVWKLSPLLAFEKLKDAEKQGLLVRDVTLETIRFYYNRFPEFLGKQ